MSSSKIDEKLWDKREIYSQSQTPNRYREVASMETIRVLFKQLGKQWRQKHLWINYADLGCGEGEGTKYFTKFLVKTVGLPINAVGIDASPKCREACERNVLNFRRVKLGEESLGLEEYQVFTLFETIEHVFNTDQLIESIRASISKDGVLLVTTLNVVCLKNRFLVPLGIQPFNTEVSTKKLSYGYKLKSLRAKMDTWKPAGHIRPFTLSSLCEILEDNGFTVMYTFGLENWRALKVLEKIAKNMCTGIFVVVKPK